MKFFFDENFPKSAGKYLISNGHEVIDIRSTEDEGLDDNSIFELAQKNSAIFLTTDRDFFHTIPFYFRKHHGVIIIALNQPNRNKILEKLKWAFQNFDLSEFSNKVVLFRDKTYTIKK